MAVDSAFTRSSITLLDALDLLFVFVPGDAVGILDLPHQDTALTCDHVEVMVGEQTPLDPQLASELLPSALAPCPYSYKFPYRLQNDHRRKVDRMRGDDLYGGANG
jgi:hypothetical protein